ncbi:MAG: gamma-glutamyltransferase, partial [Gammaproteobacteria bacterium]|nr:gamma-glutamyltransferase [Gammaproteobacteria bacterium]
FGSATQDFYMGYGAVATPGAVRGLFDMHRQLASMPMKTLMQPAIQAAREGVTVSDLQAYIFSLVEPIYITHSSARNIFGSCKQPEHVARAGETLKMPELADTLEVLAIEGDKLFYRGEIAQLTIDECAGAGHLSYDDLARYETKLREPIATRYRDAQIFSNPFPGAGGGLISFALELLQSIDQSSLQFGTADYVSTLVDVMDLTNNARRESMTDSDCIDGDKLLASESLESFKRELQKRTQSHRGTTHISIIDAQGNAAAMTVSNGEGCGHLLPATGIMLNNMLGEEDLNPLGFHKWTPNERISSMMAPTIVHDAQGRVVVTGSGGSNRIRTTILQVLIDLIDHNMDVEQAVCSPRIHFENDTLYLEGGLNAAETERILQHYPEHKIWDDITFFFGGAHTLISDGKQTWGAADPRRGGVCRVI